MRACIKLSKPWPRHNHTNTSLSCRLSWSISTPEIRADDPREAAAEVGAGFTPFPFRWTKWSGPEAELASITLCGGWGWNCRLAKVRRRPRPADSHAKGCVCTASRKWNKQTAGKHGNYASHLQPCRASSSKRVLFRRNTVGESRANGILTFLISGLGLPSSRTRNCEHMAQGVTQPCVPV